MYHYSVKPTNQNAALLAGGLYGAAALSLVSAALGPSPGLRQALQLLTPVFLIAAILITERYYLSRYEYRIEETRAGDFDLVILRTLGLRTRVQCRMALSRAESLTAVRAGQREKSPVVGRLYDYTGSLAPAFFYLLIFPDDGVTLRLEPDSAFAALLGRLIWDTVDPENMNNM